MEDNTKYYKDGVARVLDVLKNALGTNGLIKFYFNGQPELSNSMLPCIMVSEENGVIESSATGTDLITENIKIIIALNKRDDAGASMDTDLTEFKLRALVKGQDPTTKEYMPNTILYALRKHITLDDAVVDSQIRTYFGDDGNAGVNIRGADAVTQEAIVELTLQRRAIVSSRD